MAEQVTIKINVKTDTAAIERLRAQLKSLCREADDCGETFKKYTKSLDETGRSQKRLGNDSDTNSKKLSLLGKGAKSASKAMTSLAKLAFKYVAIEAAAAFAVIGLAPLLFKTGAFFAKVYQIALAGVGIALTALVAAGSAFLAVQQQFSSIQFAPMFQEGLVNTSDRFESADLAMKAFTNSASLSVFGTKALTAAFAEMAKNIDPSKLGQVTGAMRQMGNVAAGMGGDIGANFGEVSKFVTEFAKEGKLTDAVKKKGEALSPIFKKVIGESVKAGNTTYEKFMTGLATNTTFQGAYAEQLDAVNDTVMGRFKGALTEIKGLLTDMGGPMLQPLGDAVNKIKNLLIGLIMRVRGTVGEMGSGSLLDGLVKGVEKLTLLMGRLMTTDIKNGAGSIETMKNAWGKITGFFSKIKDYLEPLQDAAMVLWSVLKPILGAFAGNLDSSIQMLSTSLVENKDRFVAFGESLGAFITSIGKFGNSVKKVFIALMPELGGFAKTLGKTFEMVGKSLESAKTPIKTIIRVADVLLKAFNFVYKAVEKIGHAIEIILKPVTLVLKALTLGVVDFTNGVTSLIMATTMLIGLGKLKGGMFSAPFDLIKGQLGKRAAGKVAAQAAAGQAAPVAAGGAGAAGAATMLGGAAIAAGGAYGAYKIGGAAGSMFKDDSIASKAGAAATGALGGAAAGAAAGAALGLVGGPFAPLTSTVGAIGGAIIGGIIGGVSGWFGAGKEKKQAREAAHNFLESYTSEVNEAFAQGDVEGLLALKGDFAKKAEEAAKGNMEVYYSELAKMQPEINRLDLRIANFTTNAAALEKALGLSGEEMVELTAKYGFQFENRLISAFEVIGRAGADLGVDIAGFFGEVLGEIHQKQTSMILDLMDTPGEMRDTGAALDAAQAVIMSGDTSTEALEEYVKKQFEYSMLITGGDAAKALLLTQSTIDTEGYKQGGALEGKGDMLNQTMFTMGLQDNANMVNIAKESGSTNLLAAEISRVSGISLGSATQILLDQIAIDGMKAMVAQQEVLKSVAMEKSGGQGITDAQLLEFGIGSTKGLYNLANKAFQIGEGNDGSLGGAGINLTPNAVPSTTLEPAEPVRPSYNTITVGETKITVNGILSATETQAIANAIAKLQVGVGERINGKLMPQ